MSKQENIFDSAHEYESGNFNLVRDENLNIIINILQDKLPTDTEYEIQIDTVANIIKIQFSKERADVNYNAIKESVLNALNNSKLNWSVNIIFYPQLLFAIFYSPICQETIKIKSSGLSEIRVVRKNKIPCNPYFFMLVF